MPSTISGSQIAAANLLIGGTRTFTDILNLSDNDVVTITNVYASGQSYMGSAHTWFNIYKIG